MTYLEVGHVGVAYPKVGHVGVAYLEVGHVGAVELWNDVQRGADDQQQFKLVDGATDVATETETPDLEQSLEVKHHREPNLPQHTDGHVDRDTRS